MAIRAKPRGVRNVLYLHQEAEEEEEEEEDGEDMEQEHEGKKVVVSASKSYLFLSRSNGIKTHRLEEWNCPFPKSGSA